MSCSALVSPTNSIPTSPSTVGAAFPISPSRRTVTEKSIRLLAGSDWCGETSVSVRRDRSGDWPTSGHVRSPVSSATQAVYGDRNVSEHLFNRLLAVDLDEYAALGIEAQQRLRLAVKHLKSARDTSLSVIAAPFPVGAFPQPIMQLLIADSEVHNGLERDSFETLGHGIRLFSLVHGPRETIKHIPAIASCVENPSAEHLEEKLVGYEIAPLEIIGCKPPNLGALSHLVAQESPTGQMRDFVVRSELRRLCAFSGPRIRHQQESHSVTLMRAFQLETVPGRGTTAVQSSVSGFV